MARIRASTPLEFTFRESDSPAVRAQKLELLRTSITEPSAPIADSVGGDEQDKINEILAMLRSRGVI